MNSCKKVSCHWFRKDLRLHDNPALCQALQRSEEFYGIYVLSPLFDRPIVSDNKKNFLLQSLKDLDESLRKYGSKLLVLQGQLPQVFSMVFQKLGLTTLTFQAALDRYGRQNERVVTYLAEKAGVQVVASASHSLYDIDVITSECKNEMPMQFEEFMDMVSELGQPDRPLPDITWLPKQGNQLDESSYAFVKDLQSLKSHATNMKMVGGERTALQKLKEFVREKVQNGFGPAPVSHETLMSSKGCIDPYLSFGCLSPRTVYYVMRETYKKERKQNPTPEIFSFLLWREYSILLAALVPDFHEMANNTMCLKINWAEKQEHLNRWKKGETGYPWIDAIMRQLNQEGWIHHVAREAVGCFLTRGCLWINWEEGYKAFDELQLDSEWGMNASCWMWLSCSTYIKGSVPWYCPVEVAKKMDPSASYIKRYVPEVCHLPTEYAIEPWKAPTDIQKAANCVIGVNYPKPMVNHLEQRRICVERLYDFTVQLGAIAPNQGPTSIHWFRKDLRLHDNPSLLASIKNCSTFYPVYILDMEACRHSKISANRWNFLCECLQDLDSELRAIGSRLYVVRGRVMEVFPRLFREWGVTRLSFEADNEPAGRQRDQVVKLLAQKFEVKVISHNSHLLYEVEDVKKVNDGRIPTTVDKFVNITGNLDKPILPCQPLDRSVFKPSISAKLKDDWSDYAVPDVTEFGIKDPSMASAQRYWKGGETEGLRRLAIVLQKASTDNFKENKISTEEFLPADTHLSPYLRYGCLSPRLLYHRLAITYIKVKNASPPISLFNNLLRREYFLQSASQNPDLHKMVNNSMSLQLPWEDSANALQQWKEGKTGFPWIDAIMRQLNQEGWIHNVAREAVGCFLTRGCLWINWEEGYKAFDELQLDSEWGMNASCWMWLSCSTYIKGSVPWYCPVEVAKKMDPSASYIKRYVPEVRHLPTEYAFEPSKAPTDIQKTANCVIGVNYPKPMVNHLEQRRVCVERLYDLSIQLGAIAANQGPTSIHWFRKDLRLHDNPSLLASIKNCSTFYPVYILDIEACRRSKISANRWNFLCECLQDLDSELRAIGSQLYVVRGRVMEVFPRLFREWGVTRLSFEADNEPAGSQRDQVVKLLAQKFEVQVTSHNSHLLYDVEDVKKVSDGSVPTTFDEFVNVAGRLDKPILPCQPVDRSVFKPSMAAKLKDHWSDYAVPDVTEFGIKDPDMATAQRYWKGGEKDGLRRLAIALRKALKEDFKEKKPSAEDFLPANTHLSPYLRYGCLSPRLLYHRLVITYMKVKNASPPISLFNNLLRREYFLQSASQNPDLHEMVNNSMSLQLPWEDNALALQQWKEGKTGFPWIDAIMRQLKQEGWIHNVAREAVGCFLTRGCLWINWEEGYKAFDELQLDSEWGMNASCWMWLSCSTYIKGSVPWYCPVDVAKRMDPSASYIKRYVPEVRHLPTEYAFEPWKAPSDVQKTAKCVIGVNYPKPVVNHLEQRRVCVERLYDLSIQLGAIAANQGPTSIHWFRKDLRLHDNPSLLASIKNCSTFYPVYILDIESCRRSKISANRWNFLCECLQDLNSELRAIGSRLYVVRGRVMDVFPRLFREWGVTRLSFEADNEPAGRQRDQVVKLLAQKFEVKVISHNSHLLYEVEDVKKVNNGGLPTTFDEFFNAAGRLDKPILPCQPIDRSVFKPSMAAKLKDHWSDYAVPDVTEFGIKDPSMATAKHYWKGGEKDGLRRLAIALRKASKEDFKEKKPSAEDFLPANTHLSPYLRYGCLSPRLLYHRLVITYMKVKNASPPISLFNNLLRREYFLQSASQNPDLHKMVNNSMSLQLPWEDNALALQQWKEGKTGFPWIDAIMRQLNQEGWIHNVAREAVGCFLTRGCLWINWEEGYKAFDELQLDSEWGMNASCWMWLSCSTYIKGSVPWYCPVEVAKKMDPSASYIKRYVPEVRHLPTEYAFEPWKAPTHMQKTANCVIGVNYPKPMVKHLEQRRICVERLYDLSIQLRAIPANQGPTSIHWFRKDLRLHDNPSLLASIKNCSTFYPVYILDIEASRRSKISANRWNFLCECLQDLDSELRAIGSRLYVVRGRVMDVFPRLFREWGVTRLSFEADNEPAGRQRDQVVKLLAQKFEVKVISHNSHLLYEVEDVKKVNDGGLPTTFDEFFNVAGTLDKPILPCQPIDRSVFKPSMSAKLKDHWSAYAVPDVTEFGIKDPSMATAQRYWKGGEKEGLRRLAIALQKASTEDFKEKKVGDQDFLPTDTHLSPYLRYGCLSPRLLYHRLAITYMKVKNASPPISLFNNLLRREYFLQSASQNPDLHKMVSNSMSLQLPWEDNALALQQWKEGKTGFPWIDAIMRQLKQEGWIHNVAREAVGCFLTRGCLWINWEEGYKAFDELQLDSEWGMNASCWMWLSCSTYIKGSVPWYCPVEVAKKMDPSASYIKRYVPEVRHLPTEYAFEPWKAPADMQKTANCVIGVNYPKPMVNHLEQRRVCVERLYDLSIQLGAIAPIQGPTSIHWFRKDLRLHDNPSLLASIKNCSTFYPVYILDIEACRRSKISANRWNFLCECLQDLDSELRAIGSRLYVVRGRVMDVFPRLFREWGVNRLSFEADNEPAGRQRDQVVKLLAQKFEVQVISHNSHLLYDAEDVKDVNDGRVPTTLDGFVNVAGRLDKPILPCQPIDRSVFKSSMSAKQKDHWSDYAVPDVTEFGIKDPSMASAQRYWKGGEKEGLHRLALSLQKAVKNDFKEHKISAEELLSADTHLSPYLRYGCLSPRLLYHRLAITYMKAKNASPPLPLFNNLLRREYFLQSASQNSDLHKMVNNSMSLQLPWEDNTTALQQWKEGKTGFPWIDAIMRQLNQEGWIHNVAREAVGCFLTRGCLWINWEEGYKAFDELQLDSEWGMNASCWMWLSCSTYIKGSVPWYCPVQVAKKMDPSASYIKRYVPEVSHLPTEYVFEPWKAPADMQKTANCVIGINYPKPMVNHLEQRRVCVERLYDLSIQLGAIAPNEGPTSIHWFRKDLRLHDNPSLLASIKNCSTFYPVYILDIEACRRSKISANRWNFLCECLQDLDSELRAIGSRLYVVRGRVMEVFPRLFHEWGVNRLSFEADNEPAGRQRDQVVKLLAQKFEVQVISNNSHLLYDAEDVKEVNDGGVPTTLDEFFNVAGRLDKPILPCQPIDRSVFKPSMSAKLKDHWSAYTVPDVTEFGIKDPSLASAQRYWKGGEKEGLHRLALALQKAVKNDFKEHKISAEELLPADTHLSPYLRYGCLSPRLLYHRLAITYMKAKNASPPLPLFNNLLRREYFLQSASQNSDLHKMVNNSMSLQLPWEDNTTALQQWKEGKTGFPWIDAIMRQLNQEGWIHNVAREAVGCFLTRGCLWINWEEGYKAFDELQLDSEWGMNASCWMWLSCSTYIKGSVPWYCPVEVAKKMDPSASYIKRYVPEVRHLPTEYAFEPWKATADMQKTANCVIGVNYPKPMVNHLEQRRVCVERLYDLSIQLGAIAPIQGPSSIHWFRKDLRLHDNPSLLASIKNCSTFYPVYILDIEACRRSKISPNRWNFLCECLQDLDSELRAIGSRLYVVRGRVMEVFPRLFREWGVTRLSFEADNEPAGRQRDQVVKLLAQKFEVKVISHNSHLLYDAEDVKMVNDGGVPTTLDEFFNVAGRLDKPILPCQPIDRSVFKPSMSAKLKDHWSAYAVPDVTEFGIKDQCMATAQRYWKGGEKEGLHRLAHSLQKAVKNDFKEHKISAEQLLPADTHLSPYLRYGCLSPRLLYHRLAITYMKAKNASPPLPLFNNLLRREYFLQSAGLNPDLHKMVNNSMSLQLPWEDNSAALQQWKEGKTGFPWIDAIMRQLNQEGWIHNVAREAVGCFLTRGCLWINWEEGYKAFDELQLDSEWGMNASCWMWLSCSTYIKGSVPWYCPVEVAKKMDPSASYIKRYVPEVRHLPTEYAFEPWKAPADMQKTANCVIGVNYPKPIVNHLEQRRVCVERLYDLSIQLGAIAPIQGPSSIHWFRKDLRLHDNPSLLASIKNCSTFYPVYILDIEACRRSKISPNRWNFLCECLQDLDSELRAIGSRLYVVRGRVMEVFPRLFREWGVNRLSFEADNEPAGRQTDQVVKLLAQKFEVQVISHNSHLLYDVEDVKKVNDGQVPYTVDEFMKVVAGLKKPHLPLNKVNSSMLKHCKSPESSSSQTDTVPDLTEFGVNSKTKFTARRHWKGGENEALRRLHLHLEKMKELDFKPNKLSAEDFLPSDTHLSPYLRFGCLSPRLLYHCIGSIFRKKKGCDPPDIIHRPLLWREFLIHMANENTNFHKMKNNPMSLKLPWEIEDYALFRWKQGTTGFPWIDAIMRQLNQEGWIHNVAREAVGCFLTRGCLWINWEEGYKAFDELQLDSEWSLNAGGWMWLSCSSFVHGSVPWYCPVEVAKKLDPCARYIRRYVPEVRHLPVQYMFEPWKAPLKVQMAARCVVGYDYPEPMCDHRVQRRICVEKLKVISRDLNTRTHNTIHWFRKDLRLHDNPSLLKALKDSKTFYGVYFLDPQLLKGTAKVSPKRVVFLLQCLRNLDNNLKRNGSRLFVIQGRPFEQFPRLFKDWDITRLSFESDPDPHARTRDTAIKKLAEKSNIEVISEISHTLFDVNEVLGANQKETPMTLDYFELVAASLKVPDPVNAVDRSVLDGCMTMVERDHDNKYGVPDSSYIGLKETSKTAYAPFKGGETEALVRLDKAILKMKNSNFTATKVDASCFLASDEALSPYMRFGCVSPRLFYQKITTAYTEVTGQSPPLPIYRKLLQREFFFVTASSNPELQNMKNNSMCLQLPWEQDNAALQRWKQGTTGFPWIDAIMRQLRQEGWIHHVAREAVGCFLTRGCLWINWEEGYKAFDELQLDSEWGMNASCWMWLSCSTYIKGSVPWYCPVEVAKKMDPAGDYIKKFVPEVRNLPTEYIFEPWKAPLEIQEKAGCIVGKSYPFPVCDHIEQRLICVARLKQFKTMLLRSG